LKARQWHGLVVDALGFEVVQAHGVLSNIENLMDDKIEIQMKQCLYSGPRTEYKLFNGCVGFFARTIKHVKT
jgi:hypothetical protein